MEADCAMCHSLAFDRVGGTIRTLRHGEPEQVVADLRDFYRSRSPAPRAGATRRRPGQVGRAFGSVGAVQAIQIGRASCRDRMCQYVSISVAAVSLKKKTTQIHHNT